MSMMEKSRRVGCTWNRAKGGEHQSFNTQRDLKSRQNPNRLNSPLMYFPYKPTLVRCSVRIHFPFLNQVHFRFVLNYRTVFVFYVVRVKEKATDALQMAIKTN